MDISTAYKLGNQITDLRTDVASMLRQIIYVRFGLKLMFITTLLMYFIFVMGFYVADIWGLASWLTENSSETIAFIVFFSAAALMSVSLAMAKHIFYEHRALFQRGRWIVLVLALSGVFFELFTSSSSQQHMAYNKAENSKAFDSVAGTNITVGSASDSSQLAHYQGELAKHKSYLANCKKTCKEQQAKVAEYSAQVKALKDSQAQAAATTATATTAAITAKAQALQGMKDEAHKPVFKSMRDVFGVTIATAVVVIAGIVAGIFEIGHAAMSRVLGDKLRYLAAMRESLAKIEAQYMQLTGKKFMQGDFAEFETGTLERDQSTLPQPRQAEPAHKQSFGFVPATAAYSTVEPPKFKYQTKPEQTERPRGFTGFVDTNKRPATTYRQDLRTGSETFSDQPLDKPVAKLPTAQAPGKTGLHNPALGKAEAHHELPLPCVEDRAHTVDLQTVRDLAHTVTSALASTSIYHEWLAAIASGDCAKTVRSTRTWIQKRLAGSQSDKKTLNPREIDAITQRLFARAVTDPASGIQPNPNYSNGKAKYI